MEFSRPVAPGKSCCVDCHRAESLQGPKVSVSEQKCKYDHCFRSGNPKQFQSSGYRAATFTVPLAFLFLYLQQGTLETLGFSSLEILDCQFSC